MARATSESKRGDTVQDAYRRLRDMILEGQFHPGQRLSQADLGERLAIGRTPLREALRKLEADGLLVSNANRGVTVASTTLGSAEELYAARLLLEPPFMVAIAGELSAAELARMERHLTRMEQLINRHKDFQAAHEDYHHALVHGYGKTIGALVLELHQRIFWHQRIYMSRPRVADDFISIDRRILGALRDGDGPLAKQLLEFHIVDAAIGLVLDVEPDHRFKPLLRAARGIGITLNAPASGKLEIPVEIAWKPAGTREFAALETTNLVYRPD